MLSLLLEVAGLAALVVAAFMFAPVAGVAALGVAFGLVGYLLEDEV